MAVRETLPEIEVRLDKDDVVEPRKFNMRDWAEANRDFFWDMLRTFLGAALVVKGAAYLLHPQELIELMRASNVPLAGPTLAEYVAVTHLVGGLLMAFGLFTRVAAVIQIPNVVGASLFVHMKEGLLSTHQTLELTALVLVMLVGFAFAGSGRWSTDWYFAEHRNAPPEPLATH